MKIGIIGLGRMGGNIARRLMRAEHEVVAFDRDEKMIAELVAHGAIAATSIDDMHDKLGDQAIFWVMLPAGDPTEQTIATIAGFCSQGDIVIDGGNTFYKDDIRRAILPPMRPRPMIPIFIIPLRISGAGRVFGGDRAEQIVECLDETADPFLD